MAAHGHSVVLVARRSNKLEDAAAAAAAAASAAGCRALALAADLTSSREICRINDAVIEAFGRVDVLVNNAGFAPPEQTFIGSDIADIERAITLNLLAPIRLCRAIVPAMAARGSGTVININSLGGCQPFPTQLGYAASKAGLCRLTDTLAAELSGLVQVFDVHPGLVRTAMTESLPMWQDAPAEWWSPPEVVAQLVCELATGRYAALSGRFIDAETDTDLDGLSARMSDDAVRTLRLVPVHSQGGARVD
jgi:short-subunit dehydrogenase